MKKSLLIAGTASAPAGVLDALLGEIERVALKILRDAPDRGSAGPAGFCPPIVRHERAKNLDWIK